jgi:hypothetical protein
VARQERGERFLSRKGRGAHCLQVERGSVQKCQSMKNTKVSQLSKAIGYKVHIQKSIVH